LSSVQRTIDAIWKMEAARIIGGLARRVRDIGLAEDLAQDALIAALEQWPVEGIPPNPGAWLMATAKNKAINQMRRNQRFAKKLAEIDRDAEIFLDPEIGDQAVGDDVLRLIFIACHPILTHEAQIALTLRIVCGLTTEEIARAQMASETTIQQRIVRAKRRLGEAGVGFDDHHSEDRTARLDAVLQVFYLIYNEGYAASTGETYLRQALAEEALRLGRMLAALIPDVSEVHALLALMELQASRARARVGADGCPFPCPNRTAPCGIACRSRAGLRHSRRPRLCPARPVFIICRPPSPPATPRHSRRILRTGRRSRRSMTCCSISPARPLSASIVRWQPAWPMAPRWACACSPHYRPRRH
jgi:RNA polymerase sigma-70 factor, ECF subfamily